MSEGYEVIVRWDYVFPVRPNKKRYYSKPSIRMGRVPRVEFNGYAFVGPPTGKYRTDPNWIRGNQ